MKSLRSVVSPERPRSGRTSWARGRSLGLGFGVWEEDKISFSLRNFGTHPLVFTFYLRVSFPKSEVLKTNDTYVWFELRSFNRRIGTDHVNCDPVRVERPGREGGHLVSGLGFGV